MTVGELANLLHRYKMNSDAQVRFRDEFEMIYFPKSYSVDLVNGIFTLEEEDVEQD